MPPSRQKTMLGILLMGGQLVVGILAAAIFVGKIIGGWHSLSLSDWSIVAVILWLPIMFLGWFGLQKWQTVKHDA